MARKLKFPDPTRRPANRPAAFCDAARVVTLYNEAEGQERVNLTDSIRKWFHDRAIEAGWEGAVFLPDVQTGHHGGFILWITSVQPDTTITVTNTGDLVLSGEGKRKKRSAADA